MQQYPAKQQQFAKQKQGLLPRRNYQQMMWHARSMESGLGKTEKKTTNNTISSLFLEKNTKFPSKWQHDAINIVFIYANKMMSIKWTHSHEFE